MKNINTNSGEEKEVVTATPEVANGTNQPKIKLYVLSMAIPAFIKKPRMHTAR